MSYSETFYSKNKVPGTSTSSALCRCLLLALMSTMDAQAHTVNAFKNKTFMTSLQQFVASKKFNTTYYNSSSKAWSWRKTFG